MTRPDPNAVRGLCDRPFQVVAGKGGVGRTAVACALALRAARAGKRTLLLDVNGPDTAATFLGVPPAVDDPHEVLDNLWLCRMTPRGSMREYALMVLKFKALYSLVFENKLVRYFLRSIPSLAEFTMLGKAWYHTQEKRADGSPKYDRIIVDAPATGHAITFLSVARIVADIAPAGIMKTASEKMAQVIESRDDACLHVVALPEEMPVNEGLEIVRATRSKLRMTPGLGVMNRMLPPLVHDDEAEAFERLAAAAKVDPSLRPWVEAAVRRRDREAWQAGYADRFRDRSGLNVVEVPDFGPGHVDRAWVEHLADLFDAAATADGGPR
ncbi:ATPase [Myxococcota bacterium]|nr:ATPase [Myxococcota bacterium]